MVISSTKHTELIGMFHIHPVTCTQVCVAPVCTTYVRLSSCVDNVNISSRFPIFPTPITESLFGITSYNILLSKALSLPLFQDKSHAKTGWRKSKRRHFATTAVSEALSKGNAININNDNVALQKSNSKRKVAWGVVPPYNCTRSSHRFLVLYRRQELYNSNVLQGSP